jgi:hypothetical protein
MKVIIFGIVGFVLIILLILLIFFLKPTTANPEPKILPDENYIFSRDYYIIDKEYYRLAVQPNRKDQNLSYIIDVLDALVQSIKSETVKQNLKKENPIYLVGETPSEFSEFDRFENGQTIDGRSIIDLTAFATNPPIPGFISIKYDNCFCIYLTEDIIVHEFLHTIHISGFDSKLKEDLSNLYNQYKVSNNDYSITSYAFSNDSELFAEMGQVYLGVTTRMDEQSTGGINLNKLQNKLPNLYSFMDNIFNRQNSVRVKSCQKKNCINCRFSYCD